MADASYDVVIVGGGNKTLITAMYLTKYAGLSVGVFEEKHELGTGWCSEESPAPGFIANHCSSAHTTEYNTLVNEDFPEWIEYGAKQIDHTLTLCTLFEEDDTCCAVYQGNVDPTQEKTAEVFARFSQRDAEKWLWLWDKMQKYWRPAVREWVWNPAQPWGQMDGMDKLLFDPESGVNPHWTVMTYPAVIAELFESIEVRMTFARVFQSMGVPPDSYGGGFTFVPLLVSGTYQCTYAGGVHTEAHAAQRVIFENGGKTFAQHRVDKILIENGKARGIRLADGTEVEAKLAVLSGVDPTQLCLELIGEDYLSQDIVGKIKRLERDWTTITWYTWALKERPKYKAENFLPDAYQCAVLFLGDKSMENIWDESNRRRMGLWPDPDKLCTLVVDHSYLTECGYAPEAKSAPLTEVFVVPGHLHDEQWWKQKEKEHAREVMSWWGKYATNMDWDNVIGYVPITPYFISKHARTWGPAGNWACIDNTPPQIGRWRPIPELADHRMPIEKLYATGTAWHPAANGWAWQGYNAYKVMAEDLGLPKPWEEKGRPY
ncbi:MAG: hypothetical protein ABH839_03850 [Chloroflexota bacterium]